MKFKVWYEKYIEKQNETLTKLKDTTEWKYCLSRGYIDEEGTVMVVFNSLDAESKEKMLVLVNAFDGPTVRYVDRVVGYGLFAEKDYQKGAFLTFYGGRVLKKNEDTQSDYLMETRKGETIDSERYFKLWQKGRWINTSKLEKDINTTNTQFAFNTDNNKTITLTENDPIVMKASKNIEANDQLIFNYGGKFHQYLSQLNYC